MYGEAADVRLPHIAHARRRGHDLYERLPGIALGEQSLQVGAGSGFRRGHVGRDELALVEREQMWGERDRERAPHAVQLLLDLGRVPVARNSVSADVLVDCHEVSLVTRRTASP